MEKKNSLHSKLNFNHQTRNSEGHELAWEDLQPVCSRDRTCSSFSFSTEQGFSRAPTASDCKHGFLVMPRIDLNQKIEDNTVQEGF
jgi:hypothetical protein